ncbi:hypothetical protein H2201_007459 [Coniosporium apollinis]|uniref:Ecp2 effector protein domain-containing protein n=1 Tax=Coniosporium apollinis TaxID=61459 RepID=A0ABQ9NJN5_9PEZI|nr:hypothetical protein H2201_007459 [Coniosporium apollinis]
MLYLATLLSLLATYLVCLVAATPVELSLAVKRTATVLDDDDSSALAVSEATTACLPGQIEVFLYEHINYKGKLVTYCTPPGHCNNVGTSFVNKISSLRTERGGCSYFDPGSCVGKEWSFIQDHSNLKVGNGPNDRINSFRCGLWTTADEPVKREIAAPAAPEESSAITFSDSAAACRADQVHVVMWEHTDYRGKWADVCLVPNLCFDIPPNVDNKVSSLRVSAGSCRFFDLAGCTGPEIKTYSEDIDLRYGDRNDIFSSFWCTNFPWPGGDLNVPSSTLDASDVAVKDETMDSEDLAQDYCNQHELDVKGLQGVSVVLHEHQNYRGLKTSDCITTLGCVRVPPSMEKKASSIRVWGGECLFSTGPSCNGKHLAVDSKGNFGKPVKDLKDFGMNDQISSYQCHANAGYLGKREVSSNVEPAALDRCQEYEANMNLRGGVATRLYQHKDFQGNWYCLWSIPAGCNKVPSALNDRISSLMLWEGVCQFFPTDNCEGTSALIIAPPIGTAWVPSLRNLNMNDRISSYRCADAVEQLQAKDESAVPTLAKRDEHCNQRDLIEKGVRGVSVFLYEHRDFFGLRSSACARDSQCTLVAPEMNKKASSITISGGGCDFFS